MDNTNDLIDEGLMEAERITSMRVMDGFHPSVYFTFD